MPFARERRNFVATLSLFTCSALLAACGTPQNALTGGNGHSDVNLYTAPDSTGTLQRIIADCNALPGGKFTIVHKLLDGSGDQRTQITRRLSARDASVDLVEIEAAWTPEFAASGWAHALTGRTKSTVIKETLAGPIATATSKKKLFAVPFTTNTQVLWYRSDLMAAPPTTWDGLLTTARQLQLEKKPHAIGLPDMDADAKGIAAMFNALTTSAGGTILDKDSKHSSTGPATQAAATLIRDVTMLNGTTRPPGVTGLVRGDAAFAIATPDAFGSSEPPINTRWAAFPRMDAEHVARPALSGTNLVVSAYSSHQRQAIAAMQCMTSASNQRVLATSAKKLPVLDSLHGDPAVTNAIPRIGELTPLVANGTPPLQTPVGDAVDSAIHQALTPILNPATAGTVDMRAVNEDLEVAINRSLKYRSIQD